jgi:hypothetical protein
MTHAEIFGVFIGGAVLAGLKLLLDINYNLSEIVKELKHTRENTAMWRDKLKDGERP